MQQRKIVKKNSFCNTKHKDKQRKAHSGESKYAFALALLRLVHHAKTGEIGNREEGYVKKVSWIKPNRFRN